MKIHVEFLMFSIRKRNFICTDEILANTKIKDD